MIRSNALFPATLENRWYVVTLRQWCSNHGPQGPLEWPAKQFSLERKRNTLIIWENFLKRIFIEIINSCGPRRVSERQMWLTSQNVWAPLLYGVVRYHRFILLMTNIRLSFLASKRVGEIEK